MGWEEGGGKEELTGEGKSPPTEGPLDAAVADAPADEDVDGARDEPPAGALFVSLFISIVETRRRRRGKKRRKTYPKEQGEPDADEEEDPSGVLAVAGEETRGGEGGTRCAAEAAEGEGCEAVQRMISDRGRRKLGGKEAADPGGPMAMRSSRARRRQRQFSRKS